ncbi:hypothetical protein Athai_52720 [Actinocatenispora thailandica]|uniref:Lipoprotein n=1 Tax=Actinocatenispora thailandica TaxID=227318 RepID=A0A7R7DTW7_9ACTN|nr:hypothetical protein [Actinocatenispora thailandica]BCJ37769.1 hypothetical protein Athai_52720 [Actinocatenispora thailandica]
MRPTARALGVLAALGLAAAGLTGCGSTTTEVRAPAFTVPTPPPLEQQGRPGTAGQANTFLSGWVAGLGRASDPDTRRALEDACHQDESCLRLVAVAATLPKPKQDQYFQNWAVGVAGTVRADPKHPKSWSVVIRPTWRSFDKPYLGRYDGWTTRTPVRARLELVGKDVQDDWRLWLTPLPSGTHIDGSAPLSRPKYGDI